MALTSQITTSLLQVDGRMTEGGVIEIVPGARLLLDVGVEDIEPGALLDEIASAVAEAQAARDEAVDISGISTTDAAVASRITTPGTATQTALSATIAAESIVRDGGVLQRLRDAGDGQAQAVNIRHRGTSGYVFHMVSEAGSGGFHTAYGTDEGAAGAVLRSHKNSAASEHAIGHGGSSLLNYWQGYSASSLLHAEVYRGNQGLKVLAKTGQGFGDGATTSGSTTFTSAGAAFTGADVGRSISQTTTRGSVAPSGCIPAGTTIVSVTNATTVVLSQAAGATGSTIPFLIGGRTVDVTQQLLTFYDDNGTTILGQIRKAGWDWYGTASTSTAAVSMTSGGILASRFGSSLSNIGGAGQNGVTVTNYQTGSHTIFAKGVAGQTGDQLHVEDSAGAIQSRLDKNGVFMTRITTAPTDASIGNGEVALYFDSTSGAAKVKFKAKDAGGTVRTGELALA